MVEAQLWLDQNYPKEQRRQAKALNINGKKLSGPLKIEGFISLEILRCNDNGLNSLNIINCPSLASTHCYNNQLTNLKIISCPQITELRCANNCLTTLDFSGLNPKKIKKLYLNDNNFLQQDLSFLGDFTNLEELYLNNNHFVGSLIHLRNMNNLKKLDIDGNDFDSGLEYLPERLIGLYHIDILTPYNYDIKLWRVENLKLMAEAKPEIYRQIQLKIQDLEQKVSELEIEKKNNVNLRKENFFYKNFFQTSLARKKSKLEHLKGELDEDTKEWLEILCDTQEEAVQKRAQKNLSKKLNEKEAKKLIDKQMMINKIERGLENFQEQPLEAKIESSTISIKLQDLINYKK